MLLMITDIYHDVILSGWVTAAILGVCLLLCRVPSRPIYMAYIRSRRILGGAYLIFGISIAQFTFFDLRSTAPYIAIALPLSYYYLEGILFGMSFCSLLDRKYISRRQIITDFSRYGVFLIIVWSGAMIAEGQLRTWLLIAGATWFFLAASGIALRFLRIYRRSVSKLNDYYSDNTEAFVKWLYKSTHGIIFLGLSGAVMSFAPQWGNAIFMFCGIIMFIYIYISMQNYILNYEEIEAAVLADENVDDRNTTAAQAVKGDLPAAIREWVNAGGYLQPGISLEDLTSAVGSNRSYVSAHINSTYNCNFREWINSLRMEHAKKMLESPQDMTIERIATASGFSTSAYFCRQFLKREGLTPTQWRENNKKHSS